VPYQTTADLICAADSPDAGAIYVNCANLPTYDLIGPLEQELGKPILSANQVTMWASLRSIGITRSDTPQRLFDPQVMDRRLTGGSTSRNDASSWSNL
jgi:maleate isomerase